MVVELYAEQIKKISTDELKKRLMQKDKPCMLVDARDAEAYYKGHIPGACSLFDDEVMALAKNYDKNMDIIVYGPGQAVASRDIRDRISGDACIKFNKLGFKKVYEFEGGLEEWADKGYRVDRSERKRD